MSEHTLIELLLTADPTGTPGHYAATLLPPAGGDPTTMDEAPCHGFTLSADDPQLTQLLWLTQAAAEAEVVDDTTLESLKPTASAAWRGAQELGRMLAGLLFGGPVGPAFIARRSSEALRLHLIFAPGTEALLALPWELLSDPADMQSFLADRPRFSLARRLQWLPDLPPPMPLEALRPLRVLLVISSPADLPEARRLDRDQEAEALRAALSQIILTGRIELDVEEISSITQLQRRLVAKPYDVLHYIGYGGRDSARGGYLWLEDTQGKGCPVYGPSLARAIAGRGLRLVVLSGGLTAHEEIGGPVARLAMGGVAPVAHHRFSDVAAHLLSQVTMVLTMQASLRDTTGLLLAEALYHALAMDGAPLEDALAYTRQALVQPSSSSATRPPLHQDGSTATSSPTASSGEQPAECETPLASPTSEGGSQEGRSVPMAWSIPALYLRSATLRPLVSAESADRTVLLPTPGAQGPRFDSFVGLPHIARGFVGRRKELIWARETLRRPAARALLIHGPGGIGKTVFATRLAEQMLNAGDFDHVMALPVYSGMNAETVLYRACLFLQEVGLTAFGPLVASNTPITEKAKGLARLLSNLRVLVLLDNVEHWLDATHTAVADPEVAALLTTLLSSATGTTRYLLISRYAFNPLPPRSGGRPLAQLPLGELTTIQAASYLGRLPAFQQARMSARLRVCQELGGHPQAISLIVVRLERDTLDDVLNNLYKVRGEAAVHILLDQLAAHLSSEARTLLLRASILRRPAPRGCLEALLGQDMAQTDRALAQLLHAGLLIRVQQRDELAPAGEERYDEPTLVREYARIRLEASSDEPAAAWQGAEAWYQLTAQAAADAAVGAFAHLEAWHYAAGLGDGSQMATIASQSFQQLAHIGLWETARATLVTSVAATTGHERASLLHDLGLLAHQRGDTGTARRHYEESLKIKRELGDGLSIAQSLHQLGALAQEQRDYPTARAHYDECLQLFRELDDQSGVAATLHQLGLLAQEQQDYELARQYYKESLELAYALNDRSSIAATLHQLGLLAQEQRDYSFAQSCYHTGLEVFRQLRDLAGAAASLHQLGMLAQEQGNFTIARRRYEESLRLFHRLGDQSGITASLHNLNVLAQEQRASRQPWANPQLVWHRLANWGLRRATR